MVYRDAQLPSGMRYVKISKPGAHVEGDVPAGETVEAAIAADQRVTGELRLEWGGFNKPFPVAGNSSVSKRIDNVTVDGGETGRYLFKTPSTNGTYVLTFNGAQLIRFTVTNNVSWGGPLDGYNVNGGAGGLGDGDGGGIDDEIDPSNYAGIVNADNSTGVALAPSLRREGVSLGDDPTTVNLPDGETVEVSAIQEEDEVARILEGPDAGDVVNSDQPAVDGDSSSGGSSGLLGAGAAVVVLVLAGAAALLGGGD